MTKFLKLQVLDREDAKSDYVAYIYPHHIIRVDTSTESERKFRREVNSVVVSNTGSLWCAEAAAVIVAKVEAELEKAQSSIPDV